jgi:hypothetical protein
MTGKPLLFPSDGTIHRVGLKLLDRSLPKAEWTHEAHLAACLWIITTRTDVDPERDMRRIISGYNVAVGGVNDDHNGYHHTITRCFIIAARHWLGGTAATGLCDRVNGLLQAPEGDRGWSLLYYSYDRLFSVAARRDFITPDLAPLPQ